MSVFMRKIVILFFGIFMSLNLMAQLEVKDGSFKEVKGFVNINTDMMFDDNDKPYAVLKVKTENINDKERHQLLFQGDARTFFELEYKVGEVWVYISYYATYLKISHPDFGSTEFWFPFDMQGKKGYELTLFKKESIDEDILRRLEALENASIATQPEPAKSEQTKILNGKFSVSPDKQVYFSSGNLQYQPLTKTWRFADNQFDIVGKNNKNCSPDYSGWIDLFKWGTSGYNGKNPYMSSKKDRDYGDGENDIAGTNYDWGVYNTISNGGENKWRTLTKDEWLYLFSTKTLSGSDRAYDAIVNDVRGFVLLPDDWDSSLYIFQEPDKWFGRCRNIISIYDWKNIFEKNGAVFLPFAGSIKKNQYDDVWFSSGYWSSTHIGTNKAWGTLKGYYGLSRAEGLSVRLVCDVE